MGDKSKIGSLNPIWKSKFPNVSTHYDKLKLGVVSKFVDASYNKQDDRSAIGQMRGVVVFVNEPTVPWPFDSGIMGTDVKSAVNIHVRIPEIHGYIPDPLDFAPEDPKRNNIAKTYPVFTGFERSTRTPGIGDVVLVDFFNPYEKSAGGTYRELITKAEDTPLQILQNMSKSSFIGGAVTKLSQMNGVERVGDGIYVPGGEGEGVIRKDGTRGKPYEYIKGYYPGGKRSFLDEFDPYIDNDKELTLSKKAVKDLIYIISSRCTCSPQLVTTQVSITMGFRRNQSSKLEKLLLTNYNITRQEAWANNFAKAIEISDDPKWVGIQYNGFMKDVRETLYKHKYVYGREIALFMRFYNSHQENAELNSKKPYEELKKAYIDYMNTQHDGDKGTKRINEIEKLIPAGEIWRK